MTAAASGPQTAHGESMFPSARESTESMCAPGKAVTREDAEHDLDAIQWSMQLANVRRYFHQRFWEDETTEAEFASKVERSPRLESVAEHSWHVADAVLILGPRFPELDLGRSLAMSVLHDKMEITIGDWNPVGRDGTGGKTHAFDPKQRRRKDETERQAVDRYVKTLGTAAGRLQLGLFQELLDGDTPEARFVKAVDKLQALVYVVTKKSGRMKDAHLRFTMRYSQKVLIWPALDLHLTLMRERLFRSIAQHRGVPVEGVRNVVVSDQMSLFEDS